MLYSQEDVWVLDSLMQIIKQTNGDASAGYEATIKQLHYIHLGQAVAPTTGEVERLGSSPGNWPSLHQPDR